MDGLSVVSAIAHRRRQAILLIGLFAWLSAAGLAVCTVRGLGLSPDSTAYVGAARSLMNGHGFSLPSEAGAYLPISHYPPLYSLLLTGVGLLGVDPLVGARWVNIICLTAIVGLGGLIVWRATASLFWSAMTAVMMGMSYPVLLVHTMVWSEPLFLVLLLVGVWALIHAIENCSWPALIAAALAAGLAVTVRYAGFAAVPAGLAALLWLSPQGRRQKWLSASVFLALSLAPIACWLLRNSIVAGSSTNRNWVFHPLGSDHWNQFLLTLSRWVTAVWHAAPEVRLLVLVVSVAVVVGTWLLDRRQPVIGLVTRPDASVRVMAVCGFFVGGYFAMLFLTISFLDYQTPLDARILSPLLVFAVIVGATAAARWLGRQATFATALLAVLLMIWLTSAQMALSVPWLTLVHDEGVGYNSRHWAESELLRHLRQVDGASRIVSNAPDVIYALLDRPSVMLPRKVHTDTRQPNSAFAAEIETLRQSARNVPTLVVVFNSIGWRWYLPTADELGNLLPLQALLHAEDGTIFRIL